MEYQMCCERFSNKVIDLILEMTLNCFPSYLNPEILVESKIAEFEVTTWLFAHPNIDAPIASTMGSTSTIVHTTSSIALPIKCFTATQMQELRAQRLCYDCDEKCIVGHHCKPKQFLLTDDPMDTTLPSDTNIIEEHTNWGPHNTNSAMVIYFDLSDQLQPKLI
ncbi:hypothetical protein Lal_00022118 [Lupinus albus]|nr:hypothetical protein Lal_00022118 [Lupinus albus]